MVTAVILMGGMGILIGILLAMASKIFYVYVDPKIEAVEDALPGANCGGCGLPGCSSNAEAIVAGQAAASCSPAMLTSSTPSGSTRRCAGPSTSWLPKSSSATASFAGQGADTWITWNASSP